MVPGSPTVLKFADTQKDKEMKKIQQMQMGLWNSMLKNCTKKSEPPVRPSVPHQPQPQIENKSINICPSAVPFIQQYQTYGIPQTLASSIQQTQTQRYSTQPYYLHNFGDFQNTIHQSTASGYQIQPSTTSLISNPSTLLCKLINPILCPITNKFSDSKVLLANQIYTQALIPTFNHL